MRHSALQSDRVVGSGWKTPRALSCGRGVICCAVDGVFLGAFGWRRDRRFPWCLACDAHRVDVAIVVLTVGNTFGNLASNSPPERWGFGSVTALIAVLAALTVS